MFPEFAGKGLAFKAADCSALEIFYHELVVNFETWFPADCEGVILFLIWCLDPRVFSLASGLFAELVADREVDTDARCPLVASIDSQRNLKIIVFPEGISDYYSILACTNANSTPRPLFGALDALEWVQVWS